MNFLMKRFSPVPSLLVSSAGCDVRQFGFGPTSDISPHRQAGSMVVLAAQLSLRVFRASRRVRFRFVSAFFQNRHYWRALRGAPIGGLPSRGARIFQKNSVQMTKEVERNDSKNHYMWVFSGNVEHPTCSLTLVLSSRRKSNEAFLSQS